MSDRLADIIEPAIRNCPSNDFLRDSASLASIAISLRRIADQLCGEASGLTLKDHVAGIEMNGRQN